jgi:ketosteroid isomerase-like protein
MPAFDHRARLERFVAAMNRREYAALDELFTDDLVQDYPQSGEIVRGLRNFRAILENYPTGLPEGSIDSGTLRVSAKDEIKVVAPFFTVIRVEGAGDEGTYTLRTRYPDGSSWWTIGFYHLRDGRIDRATVFFAPEFEAPAWRAPYAERKAESSA